MSSSPLPYEEVPPEASSMIESMRAYGYTLSTAIADLIDNSIAAECTTVWLHFHWSGADSWIAIVDDGKGMTEARLSNAMQLGSRSPLEDRDPQDMGRFGLGLKTASLSQCRRLTVATKIGSGQASLRRWDLDYLSQPGVTGWRLLKRAEDGSEERLSGLDDLDHGTVVLWERLDRIVADAGKDDARIRGHFLRLVEHVESHLAMVFHRFLSGPRRRLKIVVNGNSVSAWDPFLEDHSATQTTPEEVITLRGQNEAIRVKGFILPHKDRLGDEAHARASGPAGWNAQQGFYLYRNERLIVPASWLGLGSGRPWTQEEHYKLARIRLDIPNSMDHAWQLDVKKSSAHPPPELADRLKGLAQTVREQARSVFSHRGRYRQRQTRRDFTRPWTTTHRAGVRVYAIDRKHPALQALLAAVPPDAHDALEAALTIIEETVPVEQIWLDTAERPEETGGAFHGISAGRLALQ